MGKGLPSFEGPKNRPADEEKYQFGRFKADFRRDFRSLSDTPGAEAAGSGIARPEAMMSEARQATTLLRRGSSSCNARREVRLDPTAAAQAPIVYTHPLTRSAASSKAFAARLVVLISEQEGLLWCTHPACVSLSGRNGLEACTTRSDEIRELP
jgi:hypothetical protein